MVDVYGCGLCIWRAYTARLDYWVKYRGQLYGRDMRKLAKLEAWERYQDGFPSRHHLVNVCEASGVMKIAPRQTNDIYIEKEYE